MRKFEKITLEQFIKDTKLTQQEYKNTQQIMIYITAISMLPYEPLMTAAASQTKARMLRIYM